MSLTAVLAAESATVSAQEITPEETGRIAPYSRYWDLADATAPQSPAIDRQLEAAVASAQQDFGRRGAALARYFLKHTRAVPPNTALFFLFRAVGDLSTVRVLADALLDPPIPDGSAIGRDPYEVSVAIEAALRNETVSRDPEVVAVLDAVVVQSRQRGMVTPIAEIAVHLLGRCESPDATARLQALATDFDRAIRLAAVEALGRGAAPAAGETIERVLTEDPDPGARARSATALARVRSTGAAESLRASLAHETSPEVVDAIVAGLATIGSLPVDPPACLALASRCWEAALAQPLFDCWRAAASRDQVIEEARSSRSWTVRALALHAVTAVEGPASRTVVMFPGQGNAGGPTAPPVFEPAVRESLLRSVVETLSRPTAGRPEPDTLSYATWTLALEALWEISGRDMPAALTVADRVVPISGRAASTGRFGVSADLASRDPVAYAASRRPRQQLLAAAVAGALAVVLVLLPPLRAVAVALLVAVGLWTAWFSAQHDVRELPPPRLAFLTASCLAFMTAGLAAGAIGTWKRRGWMQLLAAPVAAAVGAFVVCAYTRSAGWFPVGGDGWGLIFDPIASALLAAPAALAISAGLLHWKP